MSNPARAARLEPASEPVSSSGLGRGAKLLSWARQIVCGLVAVPALLMSALLVVSLRRAELPWLGPRLAAGGGP